MTSAKGKPTDPKLKEKVTEGMSFAFRKSVEYNSNIYIAEVKQQTNKDGSGKGQMAAWKASLSLSII